MLTVNEDRWPIMLAAFEGAMDEQDADLYLASLTRCIERQEPFAFIMESNAEQQRNPALANKMMQWIKPNRASLSAFCRAMIYVFPDSAFLAQYGEETEKRGEMVFGCPTKAFLTTEEALQWAHERLQTV